MTAQPVETTHPAAEPDGWQPPDATVRTEPDRRERIVTDTMHCVANGAPRVTTPAALPSVPARPATPIALTPPDTHRVRRGPWRVLAPPDIRRVRRGSWR